MKTKPVLTQEDCARIAVACQAEARRNKWNVTVAIGVSGVQSHEDEQVCNAGVAAALA